MQRIDGGHLPPQLTAETLLSIFENFEISISDFSDIAYSTRVIIVALHQTLTMHGQARAETCETSQDFLAEFASTV